MQFELKPGTYSFSEQLAFRWYLTAINCTPADATAIDLAARSVRFNLKAGDDVTCTFVNQSSVTLFARSYWDQNGSGVYDVREPWMKGWWTR